MDNVYSQPGLVLPDIPEDFENKAGSSRVDFARAMFELLKSATISGINQTSPNPYDLSSLITRVTAIEEAQEGIPEMRTILKDGVNDATITVNFQAMPSADYLVNVIPITPDANINTVTWSLIDESRTVDQCKIRIDGTGAAYKFLVHIIENTN